MEETSLYSVLGLSKNATSAQIRSSYMNLIKKWHPDKWFTDTKAAEKAKIKFQEIQEAYSVLSDDVKRALYDAGMYESTEDTNGFCEFLDELSSLVEEQKENESEKKSKEEDAEELQEMFEQMFKDGWFSMENMEPLWEISNKLNHLNMIGNNC